MMSWSSREGSCGLKGDLHHVLGHPKHAGSSELSSSECKYQEGKFYFCFRLWDGALYR